MPEMLTFVIGLMIVMAAVPVLVVASLALAIIKRFVMRWNDPVERLRFRVRLGGNVAYFVAALNAGAAVYYFVAAGMPFGAAFEPWLFTVTERMPEGWYIATPFAFFIGGFVLKVTRSPHAAILLLLLFVAQIVIELRPTLFHLIDDPGLFSRMMSEIARMNEAYSKVGGIPGTVMGTIFAGLVYGLALQLSYYTLTVVSFTVALIGSLGLRRTIVTPSRPPRTRAP